MKKTNADDIYDKKYVKENRTFPTKKVILLVAILLIQVGIIVVAFLFQPKPQDIIRNYNITVEPLDDGTLDINYHFVWEAVDTSEKLTWVEIGIANSNYSVYPDSLSNTIKNYSYHNNGEEVLLVLDLDRAYNGGEVLELSFKINQRNMLCKSSNGFFYEFVPCWFNSTPVSNFDFRWKNNGQIAFATNAEHQNGYYVWNGSLNCGEYVPLKVEYANNAFDGCDTALYCEFDDSGVYNELSGERTALIILAFVVAAFLAIIQVWAVDSVVSYHRGRGFLLGHGHHIHTYGRANPHYITAQNLYYRSHTAKSGSGRSIGGGCACACACACAGGGRAGCSQKDTYSNVFEK